MARDYIWMDRRHVMLILSLWGRCWQWLSKCYTVAIILWWVVVRSDLTPRSHISFLMLNRIYCPLSWLFGYQTNWKWQRTSDGPLVLYGPWNQHHSTSTFASGWSSSSLLTDIRMMCVVKNWCHQNCIENYLFCMYFWRWIANWEILPSTGCIYT